MENRNTFIFGIGGTGGRVVRALTMLLAAGVKVNHSGKIIPIIVDVDAENEDTSRAITSLNLYKRIRSKAYGEGADKLEGFFSTDLNTLGSQKASDDGKIKDEFQLKFAGVSSTFGKYLKVEDMEGIDEQFLHLLYDNSPKTNPNTELNLELTKGFKGNPNIGCIIFNELENSPEFKYFENAIGDNDRIFIVSSIFGGTGSAGFPQLLKLIKGSDNNRVRNAKIGAITIMPYFSVQDDKNSAIDSKRFVSKTKAALHYYKDEMDDVLNCMYYIYDKPGNTPYQNNEGGKSQKNDAHMVEMIAASSIVHFTNKSTDSFERATEYYEFGIKKDDANVDIRYFFSQTKNSILHPLTAFTYAAKMYLEFIPRKTDEAFAKELNLASGLGSDQFYLDFTAFCKDQYWVWLQEMERNSRTFKPYNTSHDFNSLVIGRQIETNIFKKGISDGYLQQHFGRIENELQKSIPKKEQRFITLLYKVAEKCFEKLETLPAMS
jgi:hypothetical protein